MSGPSGINQRRNPLLPNPVLPDRWTIAPLWLAYQDLNPRTLTLRSQGSPFGGNLSSPPTRPVQKTNNGLRTSTETVLTPRLPLTGMNPETRDNGDKTKNQKVLHQHVPSIKAVNRNDQLPVGGKLVHFKETWTQNFPQHHEIVRKVSQGILIAFDDIPPSLLRYPLELPSNNKAADLQNAVQKLRLSQAIEEVMDPTSPGYYSRLFLVPKPDGSFRPIIDLKKLNQFNVVPSFKMETLFSIIAALQPQEWITKIDLKDAYHHILVHVNIRKYFRFVVA